jgi:hypothetical protein
VDCFDPHEPWDAPPEMVKLYDQTPGFDGRVDPRSFIVRNRPQMSAAAKSRVKACYAAKVSWMDRCLGEFLDALDDTGLSRNTAVILTADHGTNVLDRGLFGKGYPCYESVSHAPFFVCVPDGSAGKSNMIVQPQDIFATVMGLAGLPMAEPLDSHNVLDLARQPGRRAIALTGNSANGWKATIDLLTGNTSRGSVKMGTLFTVFDGEWAFEFAARVEDCVLCRMGSTTDVAAAHPQVVEELHRAAWAEIQRRGADPALVSWLASGGRGEFPASACFYDGYPRMVGAAPDIGAFESSAVLLRASRLIVR